MLKGAVDPLCVCGQAKHGYYALHKALEQDDWKRDVQKIGALIDADPAALSRTDRVRAALPHAHPSTARAHAAAHALAAGMRVVPESQPMCSSAVARRARVCGLRACALTHARGVGAMRSRIWPMRAPVGCVESS